MSAPQSNVQPFLQDTVITMPNKLEEGRCPKCNVHRNVKEVEEFSQKQHLLAILGLLWYGVIFVIDIRAQTTEIYEIPTHYLPSFVFRVQKSLQALKRM